MEEIKRARELRRGMPPAQRRMWQLLRDRRFAGYKFRREHPLGPYVLDFYCPEARVSIEVDGRQHGFPEEQRRDQKKEAYLLGEGIMTRRFWNRQVTREPEVVKRCIWEILQERAPHPGNVPVDPRARSQTWPERSVGKGGRLSTKRFPPKV